LPDERVARLSPEPLSLDELSELVRTRLGASLPAPALKSLAEMSGGNPLFALEIARATMRGDTRATGLALPIPRNLRDDLVRDRVGILPPSAQEMLLYAAASSRPTIALLEAALDSPLAPLLAGAADAGLVENDAGIITFVHPVYRSAIYADASRAHRHRVHRRLSVVVDDAEERARHLALAADGPDAAAAASLEQAAADARARGTTVAAAELFGLAERLTPPDRVGDVRRLRASAAECHLFAGDHARALELLGSLVADAPPGSERANALLLMGQALVLRDDERGAAEVLGEALDEDEVPDAARSAILAWRSYAAASLGDLDGALADAEEAARLAGPVDDPEVRANALTALVNAQVWIGRGLDRELIGQALDLESGFASLSVARRPSVRLAGFLQRTGDVHESGSLCASLLVDATRAGDEDAVTVLHAELGWLAYLAGHWDVSVDHLTSAGPLDPGHAGRLGMLALVEAGLGQVDIARSHAGEALDASVRSGAIDAALMALSALGSLERSLGDPSRAHEHLERAWRLHRDAGVGEPAMFPFVSDHVGALIELGEDAAAEEVVSWLEERGRTLDRPWALAVAARSRASLAAARGDLDEAFEAMARALQMHERLRMPLELGMTLMALGAIRRRAKQKKPARDVFEGAVEIFQGLGARLWVERAREELGRIGGRRGAGDELTGSERRVAKLAAAGRTNREIADTLFMSVRTVEGHLSHIYRKLGIRSRTELGLFWDPDDDPTREDDPPEDDPSQP
jgi:ATP/maltotriose-dependent transcriptional regulator MalT